MDFGRACKGRVRAFMSRLPVYLRRYEIRDGDADWRSPFATRSQWPGDAVIASIALIMWPGSGCPAHSSAVSSTSRDVTGPLAVTDAERRVALDPFDVCSD